MEDLQQQQPEAVEAKKEEGRGSSNKFLAISIVVGALIIAGTMLYTSKVAPLAVSPGKQKAQVSDVITSDLVEDDIVLGDPKAPVTLVEFGDYQCPFCENFFSESEKLIKENYVKTGKVRFVYRDFPLESIHPYARPAAEAAECARDQGKYWKYHDALFMRQADLATLDFISLAGQLGLNTSVFSDCVRNHKYKTEVDKDYQDGLAAGVSGTPTMFINGKPYVGALPYSLISQAIEEALKK